ELDHAAREQQDLLARSAERIRELEGRPSSLNTLLYAGASPMGAAAGVCGARWHLACVAETEPQVEEHLTGHLEKLPADDQRTRTLVDAMRSDEARHRQTALRLGAGELPAPLKRAMRVAAKIMTTVAYRV